MSRLIKLAALLCCVIGAATALPALAQGTTSYKWVDDKGVVHYGDRVPPDAVKRERAVLNDQGVEVGRLSAEKTPEELAAEKLSLAVAARLRERDDLLRATYSSVRDIELLRDQRLEQLHEQRMSTQTYVATLNQRLAELQARAQTFKPYNPAPGARRMPDGLAEDLVRTVNEISRQRQLLDDRTAAEAQTRTQFQSDIERFRQLRASN
jgi:hypothetical protein